MSEVYYRYEDVCLDYDSYGHDIAKPFNIESPVPEEHPDWIPWGRGSNVPNTGPAPAPFEYRVIKHTRCGVWLDLGYGDKKKFVNNSFHKRFAYPTKMQALRSFIMRKRRQIRLAEQKMFVARNRLSWAQKFMQENFDAI